jgi:hypothetical protein
VQFADYDRGGEGLAYHDTDPGNDGHHYRMLDGVDVEDTKDASGNFNVGYSAASEWMKYTVDVKSAGEFAVIFRVASGLNGGAFHLEDASGKDLTGPVYVTSTGGWQNFVDVKASVTLPAGKQVLKMVEDTGGYNLHWMAFAAK